jgi:hypothetical protein
MEREKERGRAIAQMPPPERSKLLAKLMFGQQVEQAQVAMFMLMGAWGIAPGPPSGAGHEGPPPGVPAHGGPPH